ncbi:MAG: hypothetical protein LN573_04600 [Rickettsia endosymbiont of Oxypoda opaca]|nr:hypothetical protein [Rickettsia endosymbiont of Oxypoda opaca]
MVEGEYLVPVFRLCTYGFVARIPQTSLRATERSVAIQKKIAQKCYENYYFLDCHAACSGSQ